VSEADQLAALARVHELLERDGIEYWLFGGWAVDFHAGSVTRPHDDLDFAVWLEDHDRIAALLLADGWRHAPEEGEDGYTGYERGGVRLELAFLARAGDAQVYTPVREGRAAWPNKAFEDDVAELNGVRARVISLHALRDDKSEHRDDPRVAAKDRTDMATLSRVRARSDLRAVVLVEGISDKVALETLAERRGRDLDAEGVSIVAMGGAQAIGGFLELFGPPGLTLRLAGLCDAGEEREFQRALERAGLGSDLSRADMESLGFYVCVADLEEELIRSLGAAAVERVVDAQGDLASFRTLQKQPAWQGRATDEQLRRFMGSGGRRKIRYARLLVGALDLTRVPRPLDGVLSHVTSPNV
jgi:hypothetical protein